MTFDPYGYHDAYDSAHQRVTETQPDMAAYGSGGLQAPWNTAPMPPAGPLAGLQDGIAGVLNASDTHHTYLPGPGGAMLTYPRGRQPSVGREMAIGAVAGFGAWYVLRRMRARKQAKGEWTTPFARFQMIWWAFMMAGFGLSMVWPMEATKFLGAAFALGTISSLAYFAYRVTGYGRFNSRRGGHRAR